MEYVPPGRRIVRHNPPTRIVERAAAITPRPSVRDLAHKLIRGEGQPGKTVEVVVRTSKYFGSIIHDKDYIIPPQLFDAYQHKPHNWAGARVSKLTEGWLINAFHYIPVKGTYDSRYGDGELELGGGPPIPIDGVLTSEGLIYSSFQRTPQLNGYSVYKTSLIHHRIGAITNLSGVRVQLEFYLGIPHS